MAAQQRQREQEDVFGDVRCGMIESYERDVIAKDGAVLYSCFRIARRNAESCDVYDMRLESLSQRPGGYVKGHFVGLSQSRFEEIKNGLGFPVRIGRVWIGSTGEWNVECSPFDRYDIPINKCLELLG